MRLFTTVAGLRCYLNAQRFSHARLEETVLPPGAIALPPLEIGFVPTMGALHPGHLSLIDHARRENKLVVVSIFVNPLQFGPQEDFNRYPRPLAQDQALCEQAGVDVLFVPDAVELGVAQLATTGQIQGIPAGNLTQVIPPSAMTTGLCGRSRVGHFQGVATIVAKLLNIVQPKRAYFGQKDAQQLAMIRRLVQDLNLPVEIVGCPIVREASGLALSSRNQYLAAGDRAIAAKLYQGLRHAQDLYRTGERLSSTLVEAVKAVLSAEPAIAVEYIELVHPTTMETLQDVKEAGLLAVAARLGSTRLIDNVVLSDRKPIVAIDGPAGAGKSTVARLVAQMLGLFYLDTGAMYRAVTWLVLESGTDLQDESAIAELVSRCQIEFRDQDLTAATPTPDLAATPGTLRPTPTIFVNGQDVTQAIRQLQVTSKVSAIAAQPSVREQLVCQQQAYGRKGGIVMEGRDIGTHVFPDADLKIFLTASVQERARRRQQDLVEQGLGHVDVAELERSIHDRDRQDSTRLIAPLRKAADAIELSTDGLTIPQVCDRIVSLYHDQRSA